MLPFVCIRRDAISCVSNSLIDVEYYKIIYMKGILLLVIGFLLVTCSNSEKEKMENESSFDILEKTFKKGDTVRIDYASNQMKLRILPLLPDSCFSAWEWPLTEREQLTNSVRKYGYFIDSVRGYCDIMKVKNNYLRVQVVDGGWEYAIYRIRKDNYTVVTNDIVGDGNQINIYEYKDGRLTFGQTPTDAFGMLMRTLQKDSLSGSCQESLNVLKEEPIFRYDFSQLNKAEIEASWVLTKEEFGTCLKGNALTYKFNPETKSFDLVRIYWKTKK